MSISRSDRIAGAVYGFVVGDAMGATTEFMSREAIKSKYGVVDDIMGGGWLCLLPGEVTDDTQMSMCVMEAIMNGPAEESDIASQFVKWYMSGPVDIGAQCNKAIEHYMTTGVCIGRDDRALGNGSLMRAMPYSLFNHGRRKNVMQGRITHNNELCSLIIERYDGIIHSCMRDEKYDYKDTELEEPTGHVVYTYQNAVHWAGKRSYSEAVISAVNDGGDADTIAAITGSIAGARYGYGDIPDEWVKKLDPRVRKYLDKFVNFCCKNYKSVV